MKKKKKLTLYFWFNGHRIFKYIELLNRAAVMMKAVPQHQPE